LAGKVNKIKQCSVLSIELYTCIITFKEKIKKRGGNTMTNKLLGLFREEEGQGMVEYGLIIALVSIVVITALVTLGGGLETIFGDANTALTATPTP
jgi:pilus assembly protein Flp/PilA